MASATYKQLLTHNQDFRRLWSGQVISELGNWFSFIAELGLVRMFSGSAIATTALMAARMLPFLLVAPFAGVCADRLPRKKIMIITDLLRAAIAIVYIPAMAYGQVWVIILCSFVMLSLTMFFDAAKNAATPNIVNSRELLTANVLMLSNRFLQYTLGVALGGLVAAQFGYTTAFVVNSISFIASALFIAPISGAKMRKPVEENLLSANEQNNVNPLTVNQFTNQASTEKPKIHFFADLREGLSYIWATPFVRAVILVNIAWATGGGMPNILFEQIGGHVFKIGERGDWSVAAMFASAGLGVFLGMVLARRAGDYLVEEKKAAYFIGWSLLAHGILFAAAGLMSSLFTMLPFIAASRFLLGLEFGVQETMVMRVLPDDYRGRVFTTDRSLEFGMMTFSMGVATWLLNSITPLQAIIVSGLLSATPGLWWLIAISFAKFRVPSNAVRESFGD
ncbi:MAG: MFS transporter [Acidobacteriota bacterium]